MTIFKSLFSTKNHESEQFEVLGVNAYKEAVINKDVQLIDVRTPREYRSGHLGKAINIDYHKRKEFIDAFETLNKEKPLYIYCRSGVRSAKAAHKLIAMGFKKIYDLEGGIMNWR
ncbi:MAG: rhodanese-like domain-containing protein [Flavobacteriaceae bacterium]